MGALEGFKQGNNTDKCVFQKDRSSAEDAVEVWSSAGSRRGERWQGPILSSSRRNEEEGMCMRNA